MTNYQPGDHEYRAFVGPFDQYDVMGATQFSLLYALGLRQSDRLLDIGCGSLRAGRMLIAYLEPGCYVGVEPNSWLVGEAIENQVGAELIKIKRAQFRDTDSFDFEGLGTFKYVLAQSIASHAGPQLVRSMLRSIRAALTEDGLAAVTFIHADEADRSVVHVPTDAASVEPWLYPGCYSYKQELVREWIGAASLFGTPIQWHHPRQTWWLLAVAPEVLPPPQFLSKLTGPTIASGFEKSWQEPAGIANTAAVVGAEDYLRSLYRLLPISIRNPINRFRAVSRSHIARSRPRKLTPGGEERI